MDNRRKCHVHFKRPILFLVWNSHVFLLLPQTLLCPALCHNDTSGFGDLVKGFLGSDTPRVQDGQEVEHNVWFSTQLLLHPMRKKKVCWS